MQNELIKRIEWNDNFERLKILRLVFKFDTNDFGVGFQVLKEPATEIADYWRVFIQISWVIIGFTFTNYKFKKENG